MKNLLLLFGCILFIGAAFGQGQAYDPSFKTLYKAAALHPYYRNGSGRIHDSVVKRWDRDIVIYVQGCDRSIKKEVTNKLRSTIDLITPSLDNKIKISFTSHKKLANYLVNLDSRGRSGFFLTWDSRFNIYRCRLLLNTGLVFNGDEQTARISHYFLQSLGDFVFNQKDRRGLLKNDPSTASNLSYWRQDINNTDLQILKLHYADPIKTGMSAKEIDQVFDQNILSGRNK
ncbi:MAG: hypothetical protein JST68_04715 [Bacteroidetes bacterium]|nr:hypothetical protein [Bacteroidota bacterium]